MIQTSRRAFFTGLAALVAAPAIVRASSLMPIKNLVPLAYTSDGLHPSVLACIELSSGLMIPVTWSSKGCISDPINLPTPIKAGESFSVRYQSGIFGIRSHHFVKTDMARLMLARNSVR